MKNCRHGEGGVKKSEKYADVFHVCSLLIVGKSFPSFLDGWLYLNFQVVTLCAMLWSLPRIWVYYGTYIFPYWSSFLLPMVQISIMSSVYCTIVMSWERYVRICLGLCIWRSVVPSFKNIVISKIHIFWEGHKILRNLHLTFDWHYICRTKVRWRFRKILCPSQNKINDWQK